MSFFESLVALLLVSAVLLQVSRRLLLPYPALLACAGMLMAFLPGSPRIGIEPDTALALFIAPVIVDAAYDFPPGMALRMLAPLLTYAGFGVLVTTTLVAVLGVFFFHLPVVAAIALGAIVAPPDAAAASAVLSTVPVPRRVEELLKGESLFNDATALLLFSGAVAVQSHGSIHLGTGLRIFAAIPGGIVLGVAMAYLVRWVNPIFRDTLGGNLFQFVGTYLVWILAERLSLSAVLCTITFAMMLARTPEQRSYTRMRVQSFAVWSVVVFTLNVLAFLVMGMQARSLLTTMQGPALVQALRFAVVIVVTVIVARMVLVLGYHGIANFIARRQGRIRKAKLSEAVFLGWSGMRGFVTLATAFALPMSFPHRDTIVLTAFAVVVGTLVLQGFTLRPLICFLHLDGVPESNCELDYARVELANVAITALQPSRGAFTDSLREIYDLERRAAQNPKDSQDLQALRECGLTAIAAERDELEALRARNAIGITGYLQLQEEIDWRELTLLRDEDRRIEEA